MSELVKLGHDQVAELKSSCGAVDVRDVAQLISDLATQLDVQLARSNALASLEAEPVAYVSQSNLDALKRGHNDVFVKRTDDVARPVPLFTAPPAPVSVPDDVSGPLAHAYKELTPTFMRNHIDVFERYGIYPDGSAGIQAMRIALDGMNRRAAMLQGSEPVSNRDELPDGWVACSERMPEVGVKVLCFPVNDEPIHATYNGQVWLQDISWSVSDEPIDNVISCNVFHWMPLPAAPQQEVK
ncbi:TPA: DUF551 domain-containing protein [Enterobacter hormaechei subsp. steigerwaltii]|nr:DUF551 domain-containing protein [Enterobacter hormaechei subsp. steigerwaltii]